MTDYIVKPNRDREVATALLAFQGAVKGPKPVGQLSTPITTGPRYYGWVLDRSNQFDKLTVEGREAAKADRRSHVYDLNVKDAAVKVEGLYEQYRDHHWINPCDFEPEGWSQNDFISFWGDFIASTCKIVAFNDGWHLSRGCMYEFYTAQRMGIPCIDVRGKPIPRLMGITLMEYGINHYYVIDHTVEIMYESITALRALTTPDPFEDLF